jgi:hypothetical protein
MAKSLPPSRAGQKREFWTALGTTGGCFLLLEAAESDRHLRDDRENLAFPRKFSLKLSIIMTTQVTELGRILHVSGPGPSFWPYI